MTSLAVIGIIAMCLGKSHPLRSKPDLPVRAAGVNLIEGRLKDVLAFLDALSSGRQDEVADRWRKERRKQKW
ncbi:MAG: hypothetical protein FWD61_10030 [Phycisphaerales bacterium]|nr:hypothetical protein [Phycisphaerales bacterium]